MRRSLLGLSILGSVVVSALLNFPFLSLSGVFGTINGKEGASVEVVQGFLSWTAVGILLTVGAWHVGSRIRSRTTKPGPELSGEVLPDAAGDKTRTAVIDSETQSPALGDMNSIGALSSREREIFLLAARGLSNSDIAQSAHIGESTVKTHLSSILSKLGFTSRSQIVAHAYRNGLLPSSQALDGSASS
ncbi:LuxR family transcriptional regulator [Cryobacterium lactosi]|uniref:LuxR family transcriptional regulator n=2 Tax=Cryobacterium lactosi TaxID=1259202 RepID=A0A4R9BG56_9MICO|nr:LuxR family transcriptional regulator [Cryobacterium lactosi]